MFGNIKVCIPEEEYTVNRGSVKDTLTIYSQHGNNVLNHKPDFYNFQFVKVFDQITRQELIYDTVAKPVVQSALKGYNGTIFAYGQTGSGKTYTISGDNEGPGIVPRALHEIFTAITRVQGEYFDIEMSYLEIYNEHSNDLLISATDEKKKISLRENGDKVMEWHNLSVRPVHSYSEALNLLTVGDNNRIVCDTPMNIFSSRSHTILTIYLTAHIRDTLEIRKAKLNLVDLAGSERVHKSGEEGIILEEARHINLSLHYLEQVIVALSDISRTHVPYRNCTLTSALRDSLGGNCKTVMVANIALDRVNYEETVSTCRFAQRVALVRNELTVNTERDLSGENSQLRTQIQQLRGHCAFLQGKIQEMEQRGLVSEDTLATLQTSVNEATLRNSVQPSLPESQIMSVPQLQTDIIYLIAWLQDELKEKQCDVAPDMDDDCSVLMTVERDTRFDSFISMTKAKQDWHKAKEAEEEAVGAMTHKVDNITDIHQDILNWWRHNEKSLVKEMLSGHSLNLPGCDSVTDLTATVSSPRHDLTMNTLLSTHSNLLKDFQLLKCRLQSSKRSLQRIKRKYLVEYNDWRKSEKSSSESLIEKVENVEGLNTNEQEGNVDFLEKFCGKDIIDDDFENDEGEKQIIEPNCKENVSNCTKNPKCYDTDLISEKSFSIHESDLNTTFGDINGSVFSTSSLLSEWAVEDSDSRPVTQARQARSVPNALHTSFSQNRSLYTCTKRGGQLCGRPLSHGDRLPSNTSVQLTGDQDIDDEIMNFYKNKCLN